jgi:hypothetical protein
MPVSAKVAERIATQLKRYQAILTQAQQRDVSEADTAIIISDMLSDVFGYNKYEHVTTEHAIRGTFVDLAVEVDEDIRFLVEVKAIGVPLKDNHVKQAVDYGANKGAEWVILTNGVSWRVYRIVFAQPIDKTLVFDMDILALSARSPEVAECFGNLSKEGFSKGSMGDLLQQKQVTSKFALASVLLSDPMVEALRRELRRLSPGLRCDVEALRTTLAEQVLKRDLMDGEAAGAAQAAVKRLMRANAREKSKRAAGSTEPQGITEAEPAQASPNAPTRSVSPNAPTVKPGT